jgi:hypothetical protein
MIRASLGEKQFLFQGKVDGARAKHSFVASKLGRPAAKLFLVSLNTFLATWKPMLLPAKRFLERTKLFLASAKHFLSPTKLDQAVGKLFGTWSVVVKTSGSPVTTCRPMPEQ